MKIWLAATDDSSWAMAQALLAALAPLLPALSFALADVDPSGAAGPAPGDGALLCLTRSALAGEALCFELGRLQGAVGAQGFVAPVLLDLSPEDLDHTPLAIFQCTRAVQDDMQALARDLARRAPAGAEPSSDDFAGHWPALARALGDIPGAALRPFLVTLMLPQRPLSFGYDPGETDGPWDDHMGAVLRGLAGSPLKPPPFDPATLVALDAETGRWLALPRRISRLTTPHLALVSPPVLDAARGDARTIARAAREEAQRFGNFGDAKVLPWKFMRMGDKIALMSNVR